ncbi:MAG: hypothetical protein NZS48_01435 [Gemmata sp.]|nr:hypothetical protein [Gemmata sp.]
MGCALGGLMLGWVAGVVAQPPLPPPTTLPAPPAVDHRSPVPADAPHKPARERFAIPNPDRNLFTAIEDFKPVASEADNALEYLAWCEFLLHARQFTAAELEEAGLRSLYAIDLIKPLRGVYRQQLIRFDGRLTSLRRLEAPQFLTDVPEVYEARFVPLGESPLTPVAIVFFDLPEAWAALRRHNFREWMPADAWIQAAGYYFKTMTVPGPNGDIFVPLLAGKSITPLAHEPVAPGSDPTKIDKNKKIFSFIRDKVKIANRPQLNDFTSPWEEAAAYDRVLLHAARFSAEELEKYAQTGVRYADLFLDSSAAGYRLDLIKFEGRLISLRRFETGPEVQAAGITHYYEGWLIPADEYGGYPLCIVFTEPLEGLQPTGRVNQWVTFAGYSFKKLRYESAEIDPENPERRLDKYAPLLIGKRPIARRDPSQTSPFTWGAFLNTSVVFAVVLIAAGGGLAWWYRRGDRQAKAAVNHARNRNPFETPVSPSADWQS